MHVGSTSIQEADPETVHDLLEVSSDVLHRHSAVCPNTALQAVKTNPVSSPVSGLQAVQPKP
jgi:hypothetical protein